MTPASGSRGQGRRIETYAGNDAVLLRIVAELREKGVADYSAPMSSAQNEAPVCSEPERQPDALRVRQGATTSNQLMVLRKGQTRL